MAAISFILYAFLTLLFALSLTLSLSIINARKSRKRAVGFFHPYTNDGGGGERVLWCAVKAIQEETPDLDCIVFTGDHDSSSDSLARRAVDRFGVHLLSPPKVISLSRDSLGIGIQFGSVLVRLFRLGTVRLEYSIWFGYFGF